MDQEFSREMFAPYQNESFTIHTEGGVEVGLKLVQVSESISSPGQEQFSLFFQGPFEPVLPQASYTLDHPVLGQQEIFIVPVGRKPEGVDYQAVFNLMLKG